jgi:hypothetical protein
MIISRSKSFVSLSLIAAVCTAGFVAACSNDDNGSNGNENDAGTGGRGSGGRAGSSGTGSGGKNTGGTSSGGTSGSAGTAGSSGTTATDAGTGGSSVEPDASTPDGGDAGVSAKIRLVHAAAGAPAVDVYRKGTAVTVATNVEYATATPYISLDEGSYAFDVRPAGAASTAAPIYTTAAIDVVAGTRYTVVAEGNVASTAAADRFRVATYEEHFDAAGAGKARIRVVDAANDGPPKVDLDVDNDDPSAPEVTGLAAFGDTGEGGIEVPANTNLQIGVVSTGVTVTAFTTPKLAAGEGVFMIATGFVAKLARDPLGLAALAVMPDSSTTLVRQNPRLYVLHASSDAGAIDAFVGSREVVDNASFGDLKLVQVPPGTATLDLFAGTAGATTRPTGDALISVTTPALDAGSNYLGIAAGMLKTANPTMRFITLTEGFLLTTPTGSRLRAVHASNNTPVLDVGLVTTPGTLVTPPAFAGLTFGDASAADGDAVPVGAETVGAAPTGTTATSAEFAVTTTAGQRAFAVLGGDSGESAHPLQLFVVDTTGVYWSSHAIAKK